ncbi:MAG: PH domain-containing protein [Planctomycetota bacterium]
MANPESPEDFAPIFNTVISQTDPKTEGSQFPTRKATKLPKEWIPAKRMSSAIGVLVFAAMLIPVAVIFWSFASDNADVGAWKWGVLFAPLLIVTRAVLGWIWPPLDWARRRYRVDATGVEIKRGVLHRRVITVPRTRIQHTEVTQGPLQRHFGLATFVMHTAGSASHEVRLDGLESDTAYALRDYLLNEGHEESVPDED